MIVIEPMGKVKPRAFQALRRNARSPLDLQAVRTQESHQSCSHNRH